MFEGRKGKSAFLSAWKKLKFEGKERMKYNMLILGILNI
jgi:hypothetical protein